MKNFPLFSIVLLSLCTIMSCTKEISEPEHKANGSNVVYVKIDDKDEFILEHKNKRLHKKTAGKFDDFDNDIVKYGEFEVNGRKQTYFSMYFVPYNTEKADLNLASISFKIDDQTQELDTAFLRENLSKWSTSVIRFKTNRDEFKSYHVDSILDYKIVKLDKENEILSFYANCTYGMDNKPIPQNPRLYFYVDIKYSK